MADTVISPNNQQVRFRGRAEKETMPNVSEAQRGAMASAAEGKSKIGISKKVGEEFMAADKGGKLPARAEESKADKLHKKGLISEKARDTANDKIKKAKSADKDGTNKSDEAIEGPAAGNDGKVKKGLSLDD